MLTISETDDERTAEASADDDTWDISMEDSNAVGALDLAQSGLESLTQT